MTEWISVKENLPPCSCILTVKRKNGDQIKAFFHSDKINWLYFYGVKTDHFQDMNGKWLHDVEYYKEPDKCMSGN